jgi:hypothetical protein
MGLSSREIFTTVPFKPFPAPASQAHPRLHTCLIDTEANPSEDTPPTLAGEDRSATNPVREKGQFIRRPLLLVGTDQPCGGLPCRLRLCSSSVRGNPQRDLYRRILHQFGSQFWRETVPCIGHINGRSVTFAVRLRTLRGSTCSGVRDIEVGAKGLRVNNMCTPNCHGVGESSSNHRGIGRAQG